MKMRLVWVLVVCGFHALQGSVANLSTSTLDQLFVGPDCPYSGQSIGAVSVAVSYKGTTSSFQWGKSAVGPVNEDTVFQVASISKPITAAALMKHFHDQGDVQLSQLNVPVRQLLTSYDIPFVPVSNNFISTVDQTTWGRTNAMQRCDSSQQTPYVWIEQGVVGSPFVGVQLSCSSYKPAGTIIPFAYNFPWVANAQEKAGVSQAVAQQRSNSQTTMEQWPQQATLGQLLSHIGGIFAYDGTAYSADLPAPTVLDCLRLNLPYYTWTQTYERSAWQPASWHIHLPNGQILPDALHGNGLPYQVGYKFLGDIGVIAQPGTVYMYSNPGYLIAGQTLVDQYNKVHNVTDDFANIMQNMVLNPLGMRNSTFHVLSQSAFRNPNQNGALPVGVQVALQQGNVAAYAYCYTPQNGSGAPAGTWKNVAELPAGGLWSTPKDLITFLNALHTPAWQPIKQALFAPPAGKGNEVARANKRTQGFETSLTWNGQQLYSKIGEMGTSAALVTTAADGSLSVAITIAGNGGSFSDNQDILYHLLRLVLTGARN